MFALWGAVNRAGAYARIAAETPGVPSHVGLYKVIDSFSPRRGSREERTRGRACAGARSLRRDEGGVNIFMYVWQRSSWWFHFPEDPRQIPRASHVARQAWRRKSLAFSPERSRIALIMRTLANGTPLLRERAISVARANERAREDRDVSIPSGSTARLCNGRSVLTRFRRFN